MISFKLVEARLKRFSRFFETNVFQVLQNKTDSKLTKLDNFIIV